MKQVPLGLVDTSVDLHRISLQGKLERNWEHEHAAHIQRWANRGELLADALTLDGDTTYLATYTEWYCLMTRRYITQESAYWKILVEFNVTLLLQCVPNSAMYNHLKRTLDIVGELSRVALENAHAVSEASIQATGRGRQGGGSRGHGCSGGRGGGRGCTLVPVCSCEDESDDEALEGNWDMYVDGAGSS